VDDALLKCVVTEVVSFLVENAALENAGLENVRIKNMTSIEWLN